MPLLPPGKSVNRSRWTDWFELAVACSPSGELSSNEIKKVFQMQEDGEEHGTDIDTVTGEPLDREILETRCDELLNLIHEEVLYRISVCDEYYPFEVSYPEGGAGLGGEFRLVAKFDKIDADNKYIFYLLALIETGLRDHIVAVKDANTTNHNLGWLFQIVSCLAMGGYLRGETVWFGFPRPDHNAFLPALKAAFDRYGSHRVLTKAPPGYPNSTKDAGIDIISWIDFGDGRGSRTMMFGQVASGYDWSHKTLLGYMPKFMNWFEPPQPAHVKPAILIPFPIYHHIEEGREHAWLDEAHGTMLYQASDFGVIFDRFRVAKFAAKAVALSDQEKSRIDGFDQLEHVPKWVSEVLGELTSGVAA